MLAATFLTIIAAAERARPQLVPRPSAPRPDQPLPTASRDRTMKITIYSWSIKRYRQADRLHGARNLALCCQIKHRK
jgi:hypothetical protein